MSIWDDMAAEYGGGNPPPAPAGGESRSFDFSKRPDIHQASDEELMAVYAEELADDYYDKIEEQAKKTEKSKAASSVSLFQDYGYTKAAERAAAWLDDSSAGLPEASHEGRE